MEPITCSVINEESVAQRLPDLALPLLVLHGSADTLADPAGTELVADRAGSDDLTKKVYDGLFHEVFNEPENDRVLGDLVDWLRPRITRANP